MIVHILVKVPTGHGGRLCGREGEVAAKRASRGHARVVIQTERVEGNSRRRKIAHLETRT